MPWRPHQSTSPNPVSAPTPWRRPLPRWFFCGFRRN